MARELHDDFYQRLRKRVRRWARTKEGRTSEVTEYILLAPDLFHLLVRLSLDPAVPAVEKAKVGAALAYFLSPIDLLPEALVGPIGFLDDVALAVLVVHSVIEKAGPAVVSRHWAGEADLLETTRRFLDRADALLGTGLWKRVQNVLDRTDGKKSVAAPRDAPRATKTPAKTARRAPAKKATKRAAKKRPSRTSSAAPKRAAADEPGKA